MAHQLTFNQAKRAHLKTLQQYIPVVSRVHGASHPEFYEVHRLFDAIKVKIKEAGSKKVELDDEFAQLRKITNNYTIPPDVCESYEAVYSMLADLDKAYHA
ncbi:MAG TPA: iron-sulfur cluster repair di-iron protein, ric [Clostridia bacterium]|nr:iron-sulfur cluster repair di-iron protein, ric [Clostridia bacterium]